MFRYALCMLNRRLLAFVSLTALSITAVACSGGDSDSRGVRNASLPRLAPNGETIYVSNGDGTAKGCTVGTTVRLLQDASCATVALRTASNKIRATQLAKYNLTPDVVNPVASFWTELVRVQRFAGSAPIIARLPVAFNPAQVGIAFRAGVKESDAAWSGTSITHMSRDASIAAATIALANRLNSMSTYKSRTVDVQKMYSALTTTDTTKIVGSGKSVSVSTGFAQLGVVPFVRIFATEAETRQLLSEKLIAGAEMESVGNVSDVESLELVGVSAWTEEKPSGFWSPAIENVPTGNGAIVAVSDTGILSSHPAFGGRVVREGCYQPDPTKCNGSNPNAYGQGAPCGFAAGCDHGTHVAGIIAAQETTLSDGTVVPRGMAPGAQLISYRTCAGDPDPNLFDCFESAAISGMGDTAQFVGTGANVVAFNMSHGFSYWAGAAAAAAAVLVAADVVVTLANGNSGGTDWQCGNVKLPGLYVVANMQKDRTPRPSTEFSPFCTDLWAPGTSINAADFSVNEIKIPGAGLKTGTSMAAPHVAGAAALIDEGLRRVATQNQSDPASLVANFDWYSGITEPIETLADNRNTCSTSSGNVPCTGSNSKKPTLDLRRVVSLVSPNGVTSTWVDGSEANAVLEARYQTQLRQQTPASWSVEPTYRTTTIAIDATNVWEDQGIIVRRLIRDISSKRGDERIDNEGLSPSRLKLRSPRWRATQTFMVVVENGSLAKMTSTWTLGDGSKLEVDLTSVAKMVARGPMACMNSGWIEMWMIKPSEVTLPAMSSSRELLVLQPTLSGPVSPLNSPKATVYGFFGNGYSDGQGQLKGTYTLSISPLAVTAPAQRGPVAPQVFTSPVPQKAANWQEFVPQTGTTDFLVHVPSGGLNADAPRDSLNAITDQIPRIGSLFTHFGNGDSTVRHPRLRLKHVPNVWNASGNPLKTSVGFRANTTDRQACYTVLMANTSVVDQTQP